jgi:hypothetical protein
MSANTFPKLQLLFILEESQTRSNARDSRLYNCRPMLILTKQTNEAIPCFPYLPHGSFCGIFHLVWVVERWNLSFMSLLLSLFLKSIGENMIL